MQPISPLPSPLSLSSTLKANMKLSYSDTLSFELIEGMLIHLPVNRGLCGRVLNLDLFKKVALVCRDLRWWVFCSENGPFKLSEHIVIHHIYCNNNIPLEEFLGVLNQETVAQVNVIFNSIENVKKHLDPRVKNFSDVSLLEVVILKKQLANEVLTRFFNQMGFDELVYCIQRIVERKIALSAERRVQLLDLIFNSTNLKSEKNLLAQETFSSFLGNMMSGGCSITYEWIQKNDLKFNIKSLFGCLTHTFWTDREELKLISIIEKIVQNQPDILGEADHQGNRFIHMVTKSNKKALIIKAYLQVILENCPMAIEYKNHEGKSAISYLFEQKASPEILDEKFFTPDFFWKVKEEYFNTISQHIKQSKIKLFGKPSDQIELFLERIKVIFSDEQSFIKWLSKPYGEDKKCIADFFVVWHRTLAMGFDARAVKINELITNIKKTDNEYAVYSDALKNYFVELSELKDALILEMFEQEMLSGPVNKKAPKLDRLFGSDWVHYTYDDGNTLLHRILSRSVGSIIFGNINEIIAYLVDKGLDPRLKNNAGETVFDIAAKNEWKEILPLLVDPNSSLNNENIPNAVYPLEIYEKIVTYFMSDESICGGVENLDLWIKVAQISRSFQWAVFYSEKGPLKLSQHTNKSSNIRILMGHRNDEKVKLFRSVVQCIAEDHLDLNILSKVSPFAKGFDDRSIIEGIIDSFGKDDKKLPILEYYNDKMTLEDLLRYTKILKGYYKTSRTGLFEHELCIFKLLFNMLKCKKGVEFARETINPFLGDFYGKDKSGKFVEWGLENGMNFNIDNLYECFLECTYADMQPILTKNLINQVSKSGDHLIHILLKKTRNYKDLLEYLKYILSQSPDEIKAIDGIGKSALHYLLNHKILLSCDDLKFNFFTHEILCDIRDDCLTTILFMKEFRGIFMNYNNANNLLKKLQEQFPDNSSFNNWLTEPYGVNERFVDQLTILSPGFAMQLSRENNIKINEDLFIDFSNEDTVIEICEQKISEYPHLRHLFIIQLFEKSIFDSYKYYSYSKFIAPLWIKETLYEGNTLLHHLFSLNIDNTYSHYVKSIVTYMKNHGLDPHQKNDAGETVFDVAKKNNYTYILPLLG